jgi:hypothetical protein
MKNTRRINVGSWILILWLAPNASYIGATYNGSIETTQMYTKEGCVTALNFIINMDLAKKRLTLS